MEIYNYMGNKESNCMAFAGPWGTFYFSYKTLVAFRVHGRLVCRENEWGPTTGKHLNALQPDKAQRVSSKAFRAALKAATGHKLAV